MDEPDYKAAQGTFSERGALIPRLLRAYNAEKLGTVPRDLYRDALPGLTDITKFEWEASLAYMGASQEEVTDVQKRMGRVWR